MNKKYLVANWKMNKTIKESLESAAKIKSSKDIRIILAPSFISLSPLHQLLKRRNIKLAAQNVHYADSGNFTGEISPLMVKDAGCEYVIIGHSERRQYFGETEDFINNKVLVSLSYGLKVILCVGETHDAMRNNINEDYLSIQLSRNLYKVKNFENLIIAYEPVWAINTNNHKVNLEYINKMHLFIKNFMYENFNIEVPILYGGNVDIENSAQIVNSTDMNGLIIGEASLDPIKLNKIIKNISN